MSAAAGKVPFVDLLAQYRSIEPEIDKAIKDVIVTGGFILGPQVEAFEKEFAAFAGCDHGVGVSNGLDALKLSLLALGVGPGDEVVVPASTFIATALAVTGVGATLVLADCDPATANLDPAAFRAALTPRTRAVIPVHLAGLPADMNAILEIARKHGVAVVEDAAQAHGAHYLDGTPCGSLGTAACWSFYPGKNLGAYGDAGMVTTNDAALADKLRRLRHYGQRAKYEHLEKGGNYRLDGMQAAVLSVKLKKLGAWTTARRKHAAEYRKRLAGVGDLAFQKEPPGLHHVYHLFFVETERRDALQKHLAERGVEAGVHYPKAVHEQACYADLGYKPGAFPNAERRARRTLSLPMYAELSPAQLDRVVEGVASFFK